MKRLFAAIKIQPSDDLLNTYNQIRHELSSESIKWVHPDNFHLTLRFLGDIPDKEVVHIQKAMLQFLITIKPFTLRVEGLGYFGTLRFPRVLWMGVDGGIDLQNTCFLVNKALGMWGNRDEPLAFHPHLTIGRIKECRNSDKILELEAQWADSLFLEQQVDELILFESILKPTGPSYKPLFCCQLK